MKKSAKKWVKAAMSAIPVSIAISCAGGGTVTTDDISNLLRSKNVGVFVDSPVEGVSYQSGQFSGVTNANGEFEYEDGATVRFSIGDIELGEVAAGEIVTPLDLVEGASDDSHPAVVNMLRFLQTLDEDGNPDNGIRISESVRRSARRARVDFNQDEDSFEYDDNVMEMMRGQNRRMVSRDSALQHFRRETDKLERNRDGFNRLRILSEDQDPSDVFNSIDTDNDGSLSQSEFSTYHASLLQERLANWFSERDANADGEITLEEVQAYADEQGRHSDDAVERKFNELDSNSDGILLEDEFIDSRTVMAEEKRDTLFARIDEDEDGAISEEEWEEFAEHLEEHGERKRRHFAKKDDDNDGQVSLEEFLDCVSERHHDRATEYFNYLDRDGDGFLSPEEEDGMDDDMDEEMDEEEDFEDDLEDEDFDELDDEEELELDDEMEDEELE